jgi:integrase
MRPAQLVPDAEALSYRDRLADAIRAPFAVDVLTPGFNHPVLCERSAGTCGVALCGRAARPSGLCAGHHRRWEVGHLDIAEYTATAAALPTLRVPGEQRCEVLVCANAATDATLCRPHYDRWKRADRPTRAGWASSAMAVDRIADCRVAGCSRPCASTKVALCNSHTRRFRTQSTPFEEFAATADVLAEQRATYDFRGLPPLIGLELRYVVQTRCDKETVRIRPAEFAGLAAVLRDHASRTESLLSRPLAHWEQLAGLPGRSGAPRLRVALMRFAYDTVTRLAADGTDEWAKEVWDLRRLGLYTPATGRVLRFDDISHPWLRPAIKQWCRQRLARFKISTVSRDLMNLRQFARFLTERHARIAPAGLGRAQILGFVDWIREQPGTPKTKSRMLSALRVFIEDCRRFAWLDLPAGFAVYLDDLPKLPDYGPRALDEHVMAQLEHPDALDQLPDNGLRGLIVVIMGTGLRANDACRLRFDALEHDAAGAPYLRYFIHKMNREHRIPIDGRTETAVVAQQHRVSHRFGNRPSFLFPQVHSNPSGQLPFTYSHLRGGLTTWVTRLGVTDRHGQPAKVTLHQFRHTIGTRMIQELPQHVVQRMLGHESPHMTAHYARLHDSTLRAAFDTFAASRIDIYGTPVTDTDTGDRAEARWTKERISRAKQTLPNGYCGRPIQQECPHPNACLTCTDFITDVSFLDLHRDQRDRTRKLIAEADTDGRFRLVEMNTRVLTTLDTVIDSLEKMEATNAR